MRAFTVADIGSDGRRGGGDADRRAGLAHDGEQTRPRPASVASHDFEHTLGLAQELPAPHAPIRPVASS